MGGARRPHRVLECPPGREELGRAAWTVLHTTAAYYPENPSPFAQLAATALVGAVAALYPCDDCRTDFAEAVKREPVHMHLSSRANFAAYLCRRHNEVNAKLGKPAFACDATALDTRWRSGCKEDEGE